jgi:HEAT repeat protein
MNRQLTSKSLALGLVLGLSFACATTGEDTTDTAVTAAPIVPEGDLGLLVEDLLSGSPEERGRAIEDISGLGAAGKPADGFLVDVVRNDQPDLRVLAAGALVRIEADPNKAVPALAEGLYEEDEDVSKACAEALGGFGDPAVNTLVGVLESENHQARRNAAWALGLVGPDAKRAQKPLIRALGDEDATVRSAAARSLGMIVTDDSNAVQPLVSALDDEDEEVRAAAAWSVGEHGDLARWAVLPLVDTLKDKSALVRMHSAIALGKLGEHARQAALDLSSVIENDPDPEVRREATEALILIRE